MGEETAFKNGQISEFQGLVTLTVDRVIMHTVMHHSSTATYVPISLKSKKLFVDGRTYGRTFETHFIRSTRRSRPKKKGRLRNKKIWQFTSSPGPPMSSQRHMHLRVVTPTTVTYFNINLNKFRSFRVMSDWNVAIPKSEYFGHWFYNSLYYSEITSAIYADLKLLPTHSWHLHVVCWWTNIFVFLTSKDVKTNQMNLHSKDQ